MRRCWKINLVTVSMLLGMIGSAAADEPIVVISAPVSADGSNTVRGVLERSGLEGGFFTVGGWALKGDQARYARLLGQEVIVTGTEFTGMDIWMVPSLVVSAIAREVQAASVTLPAGVTVNGQAVPFDQGPAVVDGVLMVPLRAVVEAAGGVVGWDGATRAVSLSMNGRTAVFEIGAARAELNEEGHYYFARNMLSLAKAPVLLNGRTLISAEAVTRILGLYETIDDDLVLDLITG